MKLAVAAAVALASEATGFSLHHHKHHAKHHSKHHQHHAKHHKHHAKHHHHKPRSFADFFGFSKHKDKDTTATKEDTTTKHHHKSGHTKVDFVADDTLPMPMKHGDVLTFASKEADHGVRVKVDTARVNTTIVKEKEQEKETHMSEEAKMDAQMGILSNSIIYRVGSDPNLDAWEQKENNGGMLTVEKLRARLEERCDAENYAILDWHGKVRATPEKYNGLLGIEDQIQATAAQIMATDTLMVTISRCTNVAYYRKVVNDEGFAACCEALQTECCEATETLARSRHYPRAGSHFWHYVCQRATNWPFSPTNVSSHACKSVAEEARATWDDCDHEKEENTTTTTEPEVVPEDSDSTSTESTDSGSPDTSPEPEEEPRVVLGDEAPAEPSGSPYPSGSSYASQYSGYASGYASGSPSPETPSEPARRKRKLKSKLKRKHRRRRRSRSASASASALSS